MRFGMMIVCLLVDLYCDDFVDYSYLLRTEAARIVTSYASLDSIYCESGREKLTVRREAKQLNLFHKIINNEAPEYLSEIPPGNSC
jgi:hypothetical protein